jgi:hypothetical protein
MRLPVEIQDSFIQYMIWHFNCCLIRVFIVCVTFKCYIKLASITSSTHRRKSWNCFEHIRQPIHLFNDPYNPVIVHTDNPQWTSCLNIPLRTYFTLWIQYINMQNRSRVKWRWHHLDLVCRAQTKNFLEGRLFPNSFHSMFTARLDS